MYQVIALYGEYEPWWFFEDWKEEIISFEEFDSFPAALQNYQEKYNQLQLKFVNHVTKKHYLTAFWNEEEKRYCEDCEDDLQLFHSVMLLKEEQPIEAIHQVSSI
ncbi:DUF1033 family protein [Carnobacterium gallinarum]|uniref:DUF1033 family protein n=1 Tax=Carnobacterium gallinarum TaxID=2749 RepID=UPI00068D732C|nr:DUF1033 family protein [Carnobacterium gallinarum]